MFDLIGFWFGVSVFSALLIFSFIPPLAWIIDHFIGKIIGESDYNDCTSSFGSKIYDGKFSVTHVLFFQKVAIHDGLCFLLFIISVIFQIYSSILVFGYKHQDINHYYEVAAKLATHTTSLFGFVGAAVLTYFTFIHFGKKIFEVSKKLNKLNEKLNELEK